VELSLFDYHLPKELIAQFPSGRRDQSRLLAYDRNGGRIDHLKFRRLVSFPKKGDALVVNNTKVFKARLLGRRKTGGRVETLLVRKAAGRAGEVWEALLKPSSRLSEGEEVLFGEGDHLLLQADVGGGRWLVHFASGAVRERIIRRYGHVPLPPYIARQDRPSDIRRYQTLFAAGDRVGAIAAPTAGFHFTRPILRALEAKGVRIVELTLHVGPGTFKPIQCRDIGDHVVDPEMAELSSSSATVLNRVRAAGGAVYAVGTTAVRTLESARLVGGRLQPFGGMVDLYIKPGFRFRVVDHLITNFHLPQSSLLVLVAAFAGREQILSVYREAIKQRYRFYSYGDAMLIL